MSDGLHRAMRKLIMLLAGLYCLSVLGCAGYVLYEVFARFGWYGLYVLFVVVPLLVFLAGGYRKDAKGA